MTVSSSGKSCLGLGRRSGSGKEGFRADDVNTVFSINELGDVDVAGGGGFGAGPEEVLVGAGVSWHGVGASPRVLLDVRS